MHFQDQINDERSSKSETDKAKLEPAPLAKSEGKHPSDCSGLPSKDDSSVAENEPLKGGASVVKQKAPVDKSVKNEAKISEDEVQNNPDDTGDEQNKEDFIDRSLKRLSEASNETKNLRSFC